MPSFSVTIEPEKNFISSGQFESFTIVVKARYFYNKRVARANVYIRFGIIQGAEKTMMPKAVKFNEMNDGVADFNFNSRGAVGELGYHSLEELDGCSLYISVSVLESTGGHSVESEFAGVKYVLSPYKLNLVATPLFVKPGLPFYIKVQVKDTSDEPLRNVPVMFTASAFSEQMEETKLVQESSDSGRSQNTQRDGTALFVVNVPPGSKQLEFQVITADARLPRDSQASKSYVAKSYVSPSGSYLYIDWASNYKVLRVGDNLNINIHPLSRYIDEIHHYSYLILSKGKIVSYGTQDKIEGSVYQSLTFQLTYEMVPSARLLVYYIVTGEGTAELVADSVWLNVEQKCGNSIEALLQLENSDLGCGAGGGQNNADVFRMAGLTFLTNANAEDSKEADEACDAIVRSERSTISEDIEKKEMEAFLDVDEPVIRSYFPESWLWEVHQVARYGIAY
ncbi:UNVERIFIED_CONTAM: hypothetical protein K2H54_043701 [Gekko kuhli]